MFLVYDRNSCAVQTANEVPYLSEIEIIKNGHTVVLGSKIVNTGENKIEDMVLNLREIKAAKLVKICTTFFDMGVLVTVKILDCGEEVAKWLTRCERLIILAKLRDISRVI